MIVTLFIMHNNKQFKNKLVFLRLGTYVKYPFIQHISGTLNGIFVLNLCLSSWLWQSCDPSHKLSGDIWLKNISSQISVLFLQCSSNWSQLWQESSCVQQRVWTSIFIFNWWKFSKIHCHCSVSMSQQNEMSPRSSDIPTDTNWLEIVIFWQKFCFF